MEKYFAFIFLLFPQLLFAQTGDLGTKHGFRAGDELNRQVVSTSSAMTSGKDVVWDLQELELLENDYKTRYAGAETAPWLVAGYEKLTGHQYLSNEDGVYLLARCSTTSQMTYDIPEQVQRFSMHYGDSIMGIYGGTGSYGDKLFVREYGNYVTRMDATGSIILPDGDTLRHVSRVVTDRLVYAEVALSDSMQMVYGDSIPIYDRDSINCHMMADVPQQRVREYRWYAAGYRYPILETIECRNATDDQLVSRATLYYPPSAQENQLAYDEENQMIRNLIARGEYQKEGDTGSDSNTESIIHYTFSQNQEAGTVTISYSLDATATVRFVLASAMGMVYQTVEQTNAEGAGYSVTLNYHGLPRGQYVVYISAGGQTQAIKFNTN
jgi:hypothetical protein